MDTNAAQAVRDTAERKLDDWLKRYGKSRADIPSILAQAVADDAAAQPPREPRMATAPRSRLWSSP
jgi:hypothetical protein